MGTTARIIQNCQETIKDFTDHIQELKHDRIEMQRQILAEYKQMRQLYETHLEQLTIANKLKEEKNNLLKALLKQNNN